MRSKNIHPSIVSFVIFLIGLLTSIFFNGLVLWANLEGMSFWGYPESLGYDSSLTAEARISRLKCPVLLSPGEEGFVELNVTNPNDNRISAWISAHISMPGKLENMVRRTRRVTLEPGGESTLRWMVTTENTIYNRMILARVFLRLTENHPPARTQHCGIITMDLWGLPSPIAVTLITGGSILLQVLGVLNWWRFMSQESMLEKQIRNVMLSLTMLAILTTIGSLYHLWVVSLLALLVSIILVFSFIGFLIAKLDERN